MSYILDALRKSERERQQADPLVLNPMGSEAIELPRRQVGWASALAVLAVGAVALGAYWIVISKRVSAVPAPSILLTTPSEPSKSANVPEAARADGARPETRKIQAAPELKASPFVATHPRSSVRDLAEEARAEQPVPATPPPPRASLPPSAPIEGGAPAAAVVTPATAPHEPIKFLRAMPADFQRELRDLSVTIHIYTAGEADRILYINNRQYRAGEQVRDGVVVEAIVPDGAVLTYHGQRFKLPRPS
ncbi:MAG TPA: general secretion pathway protein GspB [Burkholderiales bacterium]